MFRKLYLWTLQGAALICAKEAHMLTIHFHNGNNVVPVAQQDDGGLTVTEWELFLQPRLWSGPTATEGPQLLIREGEIHIFAYYAFRANFYRAIAHVLDACDEYLRSRRFVEELSRLAPQV